MIRYMTSKDIYEIQKGIRRQFTRSDYYKQVLTTYLSDSTGVRGGMMYDCSYCLGDIQPKDFQLHHNPQVVHEDEHYSDIPIAEYIDRVWADEDSIIGLCRECHKKEHGGK